MNPMLHRLISALSWVFLIQTNATAQDGRKEVRPIAQIGVLVEYIQLEAPAAARLVRKHASRFDATEFRDEVQELVEAEKASILESSYVLTHRGQRAKVESVHEFIYPTEYDPPSAPPGSSGQVWVLPRRLHGPMMQVAFDVRNVGHTMEVEPNVSGGMIHLNLAPQIVDFVKFSTYGKGDTLMYQPLFYVLSTQTNLTTPDGGYVLASVQMPRDKAAPEGVIRPDASSRILVFIKATVMKVRKKKDE